MSWLALIALAAAPGLPEALALERAGENKAAEAALRTLVKADPSFALARLELGRLLLATGQGAEASLHLDAARALSPENPRIHYFYALSADERGDAAEAERALSVALSLREDVEDAAFRLGGLYFTRGAYADAAHAYLRHLKLKPVDTAAKLQCALAYERLGDIAAAEKLLHELVKQEATRALATRRLAELLERAGRTAEAAKVRATIEPPTRAMRPLKKSRN